MRTSLRLALLAVAALPVAACVSYQEPPKPAPVVVNPPSSSYAPTVVTPPGSNSVIVTPNP